MEKKPVSKTAVILMFIAGAVFLVASIISFITPDFTMGCANLAFGCVFIVLGLQYKKKMDNPDNNEKK